MSKPPGSVWPVRVLHSPDDSQPRELGIAVAIFDLLDTVELTEGHAAYVAELRDRYFEIEKCRKPRAPETSDREK